MSKFAKIFDTEYGQVVAVQQHDDSNDVVTNLYFKPPGFDVCTHIISYGSGDDDASYVAREQAWDSIDLDLVTQVVGSIIDVLDPTANCIH